MEVEVVTRKWGNSIGVTLPKDAVEKEGIKENERLFLEIHRQKPAKIGEFFGLAKDLKLNAQKMKDQTRKDDLERDRKISGLLRHH